MILKDDLGTLPCGLKIFIVYSQLEEAPDNKPTKQLFLHTMFIYS